MTIGVLYCHPDLGHPWIENADTQHRTQLALYFSLHHIYISSSVHHLLVFVFLFFDAVFSFSKAEQSARRVAFNSQEERKMFPNHAPPTRFGIESGLRGAPNRAPGCYSPDAVSWRSLLVPLSSVATAALLCGNIQLRNCIRNRRSCCGLPNPPNGNRH